MSSISAPAKPTLCTPPAINTLEDTLQTMEYTSQVITFCARSITNYTSSKELFLHLIDALSTRAARTRSWMLLTTHKIYKRSLGKYNSSGTNTQYI